MSLEVQGATFEMMSNVNSKKQIKLKSSIEELVGQSKLEANIEDQKQIKLKASIEELVGPLLNRISVAKVCKEETVKKMIENAKAFFESKQICDIKLMRICGDIERQIECCQKEREADNISTSSTEQEKHECILTMLIENLDHILGISRNPSSVTTQQGESDFPQKPRTYEVGGPSKTSDQVDDDDAQKKLTECRNKLSSEENIWLDSLGIFPLNAKLKKRLLVHWWIGLSQVPSEGNANRTNLQIVQQSWKTCLKFILRYMHANTTVEHPNSIVQRAEEFFNNLVQKGILEPTRREHNDVINQCIIKSTIHALLRANFGSNYQNKTRALLNVETKYLNSKNIASKKNLGNNALQVVHFGRWHCTDLDNNNRVKKVVSFESKDHIEVDGTDFLEKLGESVIFLSLNGISMIDELPISIGKLKNLTILDLRACHNLLKLPDKPQSKYLRFKFHWFNNLTYLDISDCYMLKHIPKWICELSNIEVFKGYVAGSEGKKSQSCQLQDLVKLLKLRKLSIRIVKPLNSEEARGLESLNSLSILTISWSKNETNNEKDKVWTISFPKNMEKLDIRCYPEADATKWLNPSVLLHLRRLYIRGGHIASIRNGSDWMVEILRLRFLKVFEMDWHELGHIFTKLKRVEYKWCLNLKNFPGCSSAWNIEDDGPFPIDYEPRPVKMNIRSNHRVPLEENQQKIMLELTGSDSITDRPTRLNLVAVLDVNRYMEDRIENVKTAMLFVINKLRSDDRLAIVTLPYYSPSSQRELQPITESSRRELENLVTGLKASGSHLSQLDYFYGLDAGLNILKHDKISGKGCIILVTGSIVPVEKYMDEDKIRSVAVYTFGVGPNMYPEILENIASKSMGGTYSGVQDPENLTKAISVCLAGLLKVTVQDLTLTLTPIKELSSIESVLTEYNRSYEDDDVGSVTIKFGDLYRGEARKVLVYLLLPAVDEDGDDEGHPILKVRYSYRSNGELLSGPPSDIRVRRKRTVSAYQPRVLPEVLAEEVRWETVRMVRESIHKHYNLDTIKKRYDAIYFLEDKKINFKEKNELLELMSAELLEMSDAERRATGVPLWLCNDWNQFIYSFLSSHSRQRVAARGDDIEKCLSFATPIVLSFLREAEEFAANQKVAIDPNKQGGIVNG